MPILKPVTISENNDTYKEPPTKGKNTVQILKRVPISKNKDEYKELIQNASIKTNMQYENLYSDTQEAEKKFRDIENLASPEILKMIKNPKKYKRKHSKLPKSVIEFVSTLKRRSLLGCDAINKLSNDIMQTVKKDLPSTPENIAAYNEFEEKRLKTNQFFGDFATDTRSIPNMPVYNGDYILLQSDTTAFLPDNICVKMLAISPHIILFMGTREDLERDTSKSSKSYIFDYYNYMCYRNMVNIMIIGENTTQEYIQRLLQRFNHIEHVDVLERMKNLEIKFIPKSTE